MDASKQAVREFLARDGQVDTTVEEVVAPAIIQEHVTRTEHEEIITAIEKEVHQDHYHTSIQPIKHREVLPEQHTHVVKEVVNREFHHGNDGKVLQGVEAELAQFKNTREVGEIQHTYAESQAGVAEHVHHHIHETIQPVIQKEVVERTVNHKIVPIHEVYREEAVFEGVKTLKPITMEEFQSSGGVLGPHGKHANIDHLSKSTSGVSGSAVGASSTGASARSGTTATREALESATAKAAHPVSGHTRAEHNGSISNLETTTERKFPLATGSTASRTAESSTLPIRSANTTTTHSPSVTTTTTTNTNHRSSLGSNPINSARETAPVAREGNYTTAGTAAGVTPSISRKSVDTSNTRSSFDRNSKSTDHRKSGDYAESESGKKEGLLKRIIHKLE